MTNATFGMPASLASDLIGAQERYKLALVQIAEAGDQASVTLDELQSLAARSGRNLTEDLRSLALIKYHGDGLDQARQYDTQAAADAKELAKLEAEIDEKIACMKEQFSSFSATALVLTERLAAEIKRSNPAITKIESRIANANGESQKIRSWSQDYLRQVIPPGQPLDWRRFSFELIDAK